MSLLRIEFDVCPHEWTRIVGFRFDSFCCAKCSVSRAFDPTKDAA